MSLKRTSDIIHEWFRRVWEEGDLDAIDELMHPENLSLGLVDDPVGLDSFKAVFASWTQLIGEITVEVEEVFEEDDRVSGRWILRGIHRSSGRRIAMPGALFARVKDNKFLECTNYLDYLDFFVQTGALPPDTLKHCLDEKRGGTYAAALGMATLTDMRRVWKADEDHFFALFETSAAAMALVDKVDRIVRLNRAFSAQFSNTEELLGRAFRSLIHPGDRVEEARMSERLVEGVIDQFQLELRMFRGTAVVWVQLQTVGIQLTPDGPRILRSVQDITTRRLEKMVRFQEQERRLLANDLHDALAQNIATLFVQTQTALDLLGQPDNSNPNGLEKLLEQAVQLAQRTGREITSMIKQLRSPIIEEVDLSNAVQDLAEEMSDEQCTVQCTLNLGQPVTSSLVSLFAYRIVQEAVHNARRHGKPELIKVAISLRDNRLKGRVSDNGRGFVQTRTDGLGLDGMQERCELLGGRFQVETEPGKGTSVWFELPVP